MGLPFTTTRSTAMANFVLYKLRRHISWVRFILFVTVIITLKHYAICRSTFTAVAISFMLYLLTGGLRHTLVIVRTLKRDLIALNGYLRVQLFMKKMSWFNLTVPDMFHNVLSKHPQKACFLYEDQVWTFQQVEDFSNRVARYFQSIGYKSGDVIALLMESRPEYVGIWLGLSKIGCVTALINTNLRLESLKHCISISKSRSVIVSSALLEAVAVSESLLKTLNLDYYAYGSISTSNVTNLDVVSIEDKIEMQSSNPPNVYSIQKFTDHFLYIYTSGTTGLPKSANISHIRFVFLPTGVAYMLRLHHDDIVYDPLPLYHTAGGMIGVGQAIIFGRTVAMRKKFSASKFWEDCIKYNATTAQYIGEICRYLLNQPIRPVDRAHKVTKVFGNGLRPQLWKQFVERFNLKQVGEFYGATEGNANIINTDNTEAAVGFLTRLAPFIYPVTLIKIDEETGDPLRDEYGMCIPCKPDETGEFVGKISKSAARRFDGYISKKDTEKKMVTSVFRKGDQCFRSGDLLMADDLGYLFFKDRMGDTFRWRGENVSTTEVEGTVSRICGGKDCVVFGVDIPGAEGKAGMAAIVDPNKQLDIPSLSDQICNSLPQYACPLVIRILEEVDSTGTYKLKKSALMKEGYAPNRVNKLIYFLKGRTYVQMTHELYQDIIACKIRI